MATIGKHYHFSSAHHLTGVPKTHPCYKMHGHNYRVDVEISGEVDQSTGFVIDFHDIDGAMKPLVDKLDHDVINNTIENPTAENIASWFLQQIPILSAVTVWETPKCWARVERED